MNSAFGMQDWGQVLVPVQAIVLDSCGLGALGEGALVIGEGERAIKSKCNIFNLACTFILNFLPFLSIVQSMVTMIFSLSHREISK